MTQYHKNIVIVAGEASGDLHASDLVRHLKILNPDISFSGLGGPKMKGSGVELYEDLTQIAVVGFIEVLKHYQEFKRIFNLVLKKIQETHADAVILVDYPGFNLRLAKAIKEAKIPTKIIFYISPQVWAWKQNRIKLVKKYVDRLLVFFKFESELYAKHQLAAYFIGHPLLDTIKITQSRDQFLDYMGLAKDRLTIGLLPGSRNKEIEQILPPMLQAAQILFQKYSKVQFLLLKAPTIGLATVKRYLEGVDIPIKIVEELTYNGINASDACLVASGTATLETAILRKPMVVIYKTSFLTYLLAKLFIKIPYIGLVNVVAGKKIIPECIQDDANPQKIASELENILKDEIRIAEIKSELAKVGKSLGEPGANHRAAEIILKSLA